MCEIRIAGELWEIALQTAVRQRHGRNQKESDKYRTLRGHIFTLKSNAEQSRNDGNGGSSC